MLVTAAKHLNNLYLMIMSNDRPPIPAALERDLMIEAGYRCAVCKTTEPLQIDHIEEWSVVLKHEFENMIVLCANCHAASQPFAYITHDHDTGTVSVIESRQLLFD